MDNAVAKKEEAKADLQIREQTRGGVSFTPRVDILETDKELVIYVDLPGCKPEDVDVSYDGGQFEIYAKCQPGPENVDFLLKQYEMGDFHRSFTIHEPIDADNITATLKQGVLTVRLPKSSASASKRIAVQRD